MMQRALNLFSCLHLYFTQTQKSLCEPVHVKKVRRNINKDFWSTTKNDSVIFQSLVLFFLCRCLFGICCCFFFLRLRPPLVKRPPVSSAMSFSKYQKFPSQITIFETSCIKRPPLVSNRDHFN